MEHESYNNFIINKYFIWYCNILQKSLKENRVYDSNIYEKHHGLPKCLGGASTYVLTFKEHFIVHKLLTKFTKGRDKYLMLLAFDTFFKFSGKAFNKRVSTKISSAEFSLHKKVLIEYIKKYRKYAFKKEIFKIKNKKTNEEFTGTRREIVNHCKITSQEMYNLISATNNRRSWHSKNWGLYIKTKNIYSYELLRTRVLHKKIKCEHCKKEISKANYARWHGNNCKTIDYKGHMKRCAQIENLNKKL